MLGLRESWPLRGVCRRWRRVVEEREWASVDLRIKGVSGTAALSALLGGGARKLRLSAGSSVALRPELAAGEEEADSEQAAASDDLDAYRPRLRPSARRGGGESWRPASHERWLEAALIALAAVATAADPTAAAAGQPQPQPRAVTGELLGCNGRLRVPSLGAFLSAYLLGVLRALRPAAAVAGQSKRKSKSKPAPAPAAASALESLSLRSLTLCFGEFDGGVGPEAAAAIAAACPLLRSIVLQPDVNEGAKVVAAFAPLAHLEDLLLLIGGSFFNASEGILALAGGPAGQSLKSFAFTRRRGLFKEGNFPMQYPSYPESADIDSEAVLALSRMPKLECIKKMQIILYPFDPAAILPPGRIASLREIWLGIPPPPPPPPPPPDLVQGLGPPRAPAAGGGDLLPPPPLQTRPGAHARRRPGEPRSPPPPRPRLSRLGLELTLAGGRASPLADLVLCLDEPLPEAAAGAIVALPALERLRVFTPQSLYEQLLFVEHRPKLSVCCRPGALAADTDSAAAVAAVLEGRGK
eukprot:tig00000073_g1723.t1